MGEGAAEVGGGVDDLAVAHAVRCPQRLAVAGPDATLRYGELAARATALGAALRAAGVGRETPVGLCLPRSAALVTAALGILRAGGGYVAVDPAQPAARVRSILSGAAVVVGAPDTPVPPGVPVLPADGHPPGACQPPPWHPAALAYVIHTSGSTGKPKGVQVQHGELRHLVDWHRRAFGLTAADRVAQLASPGFDASVWDVWATLTAGAALCVPDEDTRLDPPVLRDWLLSERISVVFVPTGLAEELLALRWPRTAALRLLLTGGDALRGGPPAGLPFTVVNNYGITEATVVSTSGPVAPARPGPPTIGRPIDRVEAHVVDAVLRPVPDGEAGELLLGGAGLARGYAAAPAATAARFVPDHLGGRPGARLLRTGDLVRRDPGGELTHLGRVDDQLSRNGVRVEPGEVAAALREHPGVRDAVVVAERGGPGRLLAYLVPGEGKRPDRAAMTAFAEAHLPTAMVPNEYLWLSEFPLTHNGKLDRAMLPPPPPPGPDGAPRTELEAALVPVVAGVLKVPTVDADANFFQMGGHSLLGAQLVLLLRERYEVELSLRFLFANPTVRLMAAGIEALVRRDVEAMSEEQARELLAGDR